MSANGPSLPKRLSFTVSALWGRPDLSEIGLNRRD